MPFKAPKTAHGGSLKPNRTHGVAKRHPSDPLGASRDLLGASCDLLDTSRNLLDASCGLLGTSCDLLDTPRGLLGTSRDPEGRQGGPQAAEGDPVGGSRGGRAAQSDVREVSVCVLWRHGGEPWAVWTMSRRSGTRSTLPKARHGPPRNPVLALSTPRAAHGGSLKSNRPHGVAEMHDFRAQSRSWGIPAYSPSRPKC